MRTSGLHPLFLLFSIFLASCALPIRVSPPGTLVDSPEAMGQPRRVKLGGQFFFTPEAELTPDVALQDPQTSAPPFALVDDLTAIGGLAFTDRFEGELRFPFHARIKYQFLGDPKMVSRRGNFSGSLATGVGYWSSRRSATDTINGTSTYDKKETDLFAGLSLGYRFTDAFLLFIGGHFNHVLYSGSFTTSNRSITDQPFSGNIATAGPNLGVEFNLNAVNIRVQLTSESTKAAEWSNTYVAAGAEISVYFGGNPPESPPDPEGQPTSL